jgi:hypothetical protein
VIRGARPDLHAGLSTIVDPSESGRG